MTLHRGERGLQKGRQAALVKADNKKPAEKPGLVLLQPADQRKGDEIIGTDHRIILLCFFKKMMKAGSGIGMIVKHMPGPAKGSFLCQIHCRGGVDPVQRRSVLSPMVKIRKNFLHGGIGIRNNAADGKITKQRTDQQQQGLVPPANTVDSGSNPKGSRTD